MLTADGNRLLDIDALADQTGCCIAGYLKIQYITNTDFEYNYPDTTFLTYTENATGLQVRCDSRYIYQGIVGDSIWKIYQYDQNHQLLSTEDENAYKTNFTFIGGRRSGYTTESNGTLVFDESITYGQANQSNECDTLMELLLGKDYYLANLKTRY